jgi:ribonuclease BN (tRNA processing enzyme)
LHIYGPGGTPETLKHVLEHNQSTETFPVSLRDMSASKDIQSVRESQVIVWDEDNVHLAESTSRLSDEAVVIRIHKSHAHPGGVYVYRISYRGKSIVYATDTEGYIGTDRRLVNFARDADVLIHDAQYSDEHYYGCLAGFPSTQGYGHSTAKMAAEVAASAESGQLILFHHDPAYSDEFVAAQEAHAKNIFPDSRAAYEGMEIALIPSPSPEGEGSPLSLRERVRVRENPCFSAKLRKVSYLIAGLSLDFGYSAKVSVSFPWSCFLRRGRRLELSLTVLRYTPRLLSLR